MSDTPSIREPVRRTRPARHHAAVSCDIVTDLCAALFARLCGYDQRVRARQYMDGLLRAEGRKSIANIAASVGVPGDEQRLHHFVNSSRWAVSPVRGALAAYLGGIDTAAAWVALPVSIPKTGRRMAGVSSHFSAEAGRRITGQRAWGMWYASERLVAPVSWRLGLPGTSPAPRELPDEPGASAVQGCMADLLDEVPSWRGDPRLIVTDARGGGRAELTRLLSRPSPVAVRVSGHTLLAVTGRRRGAGSAERLAPARSVLDRARRARLPSRGEDSAATARVRLPGPRGTARPGTPSEISLLGVWHEPRGEPDEFWLTNAEPRSPQALLRVTRLAHRVDTGWRTRGRDVGLRDYEGRSFQGWHRHMTLASCAYAMAELRSAGASGGFSPAA
ncbi:transposase [Streptomyces sp. CAU 1734]|uniref:IS701 family transposase n=1 Tax=Streptomyces sp. CAU 1734 TaxID=3140360 RepID=UPI0032601345